MQQQAHTAPTQKQMTAAEMGTPPSKESVERAEAPSRAIDSDSREATAGVDTAGGKTVVGSDGGKDDDCSAASEDGEEGD